MPEDLIGISIHSKNVIAKAALAIQRHNLGQVAQANAGDAASSQNQRTVIAHGQPAVATNEHSRDGIDIVAGIKDEGAIGKLHSIDNRLGRNDIVLVENAEQETSILISLAKGIESASHGLIESGNHVLVIAKRHHDQLLNSIIDTVVYEPLISIRTGLRGRGKRNVSAPGYLIRRYACRENRLRGHLVTGKEPRAKRAHIANQELSVP